MALLSEEDLKFCLSIDNETMYDFSGKIDGDIIVEIAKAIEKLLIKNNANPAKMQNVFELIVETLQNILNYSYGTKKLDENKREAPCIFKLSYERKYDIYTLDSYNLIKSEQKEIIEKKLNEIKDLDDKALRKLLRKKVRSKEDNHEKGAGLGFIAMARKTIKDIEISFLPHSVNILKYKQRLVI
jgi:hypothetical protein